MRLIECVPNISEGRDMTVIDALADAVSNTAGVQLLHRTSDADHHRSVLTFVGLAKSLKEAVLKMYQDAATMIDLRKHKGEHPRIGAIDVCPFIPLEETSMAECVDLANEVGQLVAQRFDLPVYLYEEAANKVERKRLENIRRGGYEGLPEKFKDKEWLPDFGPAQINPGMGATVIGARKILIAYNVNLQSKDIKIAREIARTVRESNGGLKNVKALGIAMSRLDMVQVSLNLTDYQVTPIHAVVELIRQEAAKYGVEMAHSELIGLAPAQAFISASAHYLQLEDLSKERILEFIINKEEIGINNNDS